MAKQTGPLSGNRDDLLMLYCLTPTGMRPEGMALLGEYLNAQTYTGKLTWVIVDDCDPQTRIPKTRKMFHVEHVRPHWRWHPGMNTQVASMDAGLKLVPDNATLFVLEDDDIYLPDYIQTMLHAIENAELVGEIDSQYYNVATGKWRVLKGKYHASLASTVCRGKALASLKLLCGGGIQRMLDVTLWKTFKGKKQLLSDNNVIGIKGLPGRAGIGIGHRTSFGSVDIDDTLRLWAGQYADNYRIFLRAA
jgi:hypothetical protein